jgi:FtsP/CotA-like multicopper oxidase with cupredoxin domain
MLPALSLLILSMSAGATSFRVQCPTSTALHPNGDGIKCQQVSGGDGYATMGDGTQTYLFGFGPLSGLADLANGLPGTQVPVVFNNDNSANLGSIFVGAPVNQTTLAVPSSSTGFNGAVGLVPDYSSDPWAPNTAYPLNATVRNAGGIYVATSAGTSASSGGPTGTGTAITDGTGTLRWAYQSSLLTGHVDPRLIMDVGVMNANMPAPLMAIDEDDEFFLTLTNVGMIMRPDLFEQHTIHFHGYPNASAFYDGVPDASVAINIGGSFSYYYLAPDAGTYFFHCHISPPEHLQMGMVGQLYVRPRQNRVPSNMTLYSALSAYENASLSANPTYADYEPLRKRCAGDILCSSPLPAVGDNSTPGSGNTLTYAYNDGDGSTRYDVEYPIQIHGFDPNFHFVGMTFNPESFTDMKDKHFLLNGRSYPDTVSPGTMVTQSSDGTFHASQPISTIINIPAGGKALLRFSDLDVTEYQTLASLGIPMHVIAQNARLLRDLAGNDMTYYANSITLAGGESLDVILDASDTSQYPPGSKFYLYTPNLDHLSNDAENFGGLMTEVNICPTTVNPTTKACT